MNLGALGFVGLVSLGLFACSAERDGIDGKEARARPVESVGVTTAADTIAPPCDEDNPITGETRPSDPVMADDFVRFVRTHAWNCMHRQWHDVRSWDAIKFEDPRDPELAYMKSKGWTRADVQEGATGNGLEFLAMHRAMISALRHDFPEHAADLKGWEKPPTTSTAEDPVPKGGAHNPFTGPFSPNMTKAVTRLTSDLTSFPSDDAIGLYIQTSIRWTADAPDAVSPDKTTSLHGYLHNRFDDPKSAIRMDRFSRNIENRLFWKLHGYIDNTWTKYRLAMKADDHTDATYLKAMGDACANMMMGTWDANEGVCTGAAMPNMPNMPGM